MATLAEVIATRVADVKRRSPVAVSPATPLSEVVAQIREANRGSVVVVDAGQVIGIFTERDLMTRVNHAGDGWKQTPVKDVMTESPVTIRPDQSVEDAMNLMVAGGYRHLPLVDGGDLVGLLSIRDVLKHLVSYFPKEFLNQPAEPEREPTSPWGG